MTREHRIKAEAHSCPRCGRCGEATRLFGIERHPAADGTVLETYVCERCDVLQTATVPRKPRIGVAERGKSAPTLALLANTAFDDETTSRLGVAYEAAWHRLQASGSTLVDTSHAAATRERLAKCILEMGQRGETDSNRLVERALTRLVKSNGAAAQSSDL